MVHETAVSFAGEVVVSWFFLFDSSMRNSDKAMLGEIVLV